MENSLQLSRTRLIPIRGGGFGVEKLKENKSKFPADKSTQTLFRTSLKNNYTMLEAVDRKAHILISINAIILSLLLGSGLSQGELIDISDLPILSLIVFSSISMSLPFVDK